MDDITLEVIPDCQKAQGLAATDIQSNEITVSWTQEDASSWNVYYRAKGSDEWQGPVSASETSATIPNLEANTKYEIYVETVCGDINPTTVFITVKTLCGDQELPYITSFEDENVNELPYCWTQIYTSTSNTAYPRVYDSYAKTGSHSLQFLCSATDPTIIALPAVAESLQDLQLSFQHLVYYNQSYYGTLKVGVTNSLTDTSAIEYVWSKDATQMTANTHTKEKVSFTDIETTGDQLYIVFNRCNSAGYSWYIDDVKLEVIPECGEATQVTVIPTDNSATVTWNQTETNVTSWIVYYKKSTDTEYTASDVLSEKTFTIEGLTSTTTYSVYVETLCGENNPVSDVVTFKTVCAGLTLEDLPKTWGFESSEGLGSGTTYYPLPDCWTRVTSNNYPYAYNYDSKSGSYSLYYYMYSYNGSGSASVVALPYINTESVEVKDLQLNFYAKTSSGYGTTLEIGVLTDPADESTFTSVQSISLTSSSYELFEVPFNSYEGEGAYIAIKYVPGTGYYAYAYIDDVTLDVIPDCPKPNDLTVTAAPTSAKVTWSQGGEEATSWVVYYKQTSATEWTSQTVSEMEYTIDNLTASTSYEVKVAAVCGDDESAYPVSVIKTFKTPCDGLTLTDLPKTWDFESGNTGGTSSYPLPACWQKVTSGNYPYTYSYSYYANSGNYSLYYYNYSGGPEAIVTLPYINTESVEVKDLQFSFYARTYSGYSGTLEVGVLTDPTNSNSFTTIQSISLTSTYTLYEVPFSAYEGEGAYMAFKIVSGSNYVLIDDVTLELTPECAKPNDVTVSEITSSGAKVTWNQAGDNISSWIVYYRESGTDTWTEANANETEYSLTELKSATKYEVKIAAVCGDDENAYPNSALVSFVTECASLTENDLPKTWGFENDVTYSMPLCWLQTEGNYDEKAGVYGYYAKSGSNSLLVPVYIEEYDYDYDYDYSYYYYAKDAAVALPPYNGDITNLQLTVWARPNAAASYLGTLQIGISTNPSDTTNFVLVYSKDATTMTAQTYEEIICNFSEVEINDANATEFYPVIRFADVQNY